MGFTMPITPDQHTDFLIIGAGFAGLVVAERLASAGWQCVVADRRPHLGGNAHDRIDEAGVLIHPYGPHYFRTNSPMVVDYLSQFTGWHEVAYTIKSHTRGSNWCFPINLNTFEQYLGKPSTEEEFTAWLDQHRIPITNPQNSEEAIISQVGREFYQLFFESYTLKQWKRHPRELDASVCGRIPVRTNRDDRYLTESFQALPDHGYSAMFERIANHPGIDLQLSIDFTEAKARWQFKHLIFTGAIDEFYHYCHGPLPYRSLRFEMESFTANQLLDRETIAGKPGFWQPTMQVNYPDADIPFTRIVEIKHATGQITPNTTIVREYPADWSPGKEAYYPIPAPDTRAIYQKYANLAASEPHTSFIGRLATYHYYNMDQVTAMALNEAAKLIMRYGRNQTTTATHS